MITVDRVKWRIRIRYMRATGKKRVALASFPRSGNTWLRFMIEQGTGEQSGSVYRDRVMTRGSEGIVIKTHELDSWRYTSAIHLLRNPFDAIESFFYWKRDVDGKAGVDWHTHVEESVLTWRAHTEHWLDANCPTYRARYEDFHEDTINQLRSLVLWLGYDLPPEQLLSVVERSRLRKMRRRNPEVGSRFFRRGQVGKGLARFTVEQRRFVMEALHDLLIACGYEAGQVGKSCIMSSSGARCL